MSPEEKINSEGSEVVHQWQKEIIAMPRSSSESPTDESAFPSAPRTVPWEHWNPWVDHRLCFKHASGTQKQDKAPEGKLRFEGG